MSISTEEYKARLNYEALPEWRKFIHGWQKSISWNNLSGIWGYPYMYFQMRKILLDANTRCSIRECKNKYKIKGLCPKHYQRFVSNDIPLEKFIEFMDEDADNFNYLVTLYKSRK